MAAAAPFLPTPFRWESEYDSGVAPYTLIELRILEIEGAIKEKLDWTKKISNAEITEKWRKECGASQKEWDYIIPELIDEGFQSVDDIVETGVPGVFWKRGVRPTEELLQGVERLEGSVGVDWHPGSEGFVRDLVHPSLYCYVDGRTPVLEAPCGSWEEMLKAGAMAKPGGVLSGGIKTPTRSTKFMWLPSEVEVGGSGECKFVSYINNLHPVQHAALVSSIESLFSSFIPLFNRCLSNLRTPAPRRHAVDMYNLYVDFSGDEDDDQGREEWYETRTVKSLEFPKYERRERGELSYNLNGRRLQVIVKLANIHLTPEKPNYSGGSWHVEGMEGEHIVASGIFYYAEENISESRLHFRVCVENPPYEQSDDNGVRQVYGMENEGPMNQSLGRCISPLDFDDYSDMAGSVPTCLGTMLVFPNILQHRLAPFSLSDTSRPGFRKIIVFFLVDPNDRVLSTDRVPPQQKDWSGSGSMTVEEALQFRLDLMAERTTVVERNNEELYERPFSLCEH